jgi:hypothetical protein
LNELYNFLCTWIIAAQEEKPSEALQGSQEALTGTKKIALRYLKESEERNIASEQL